MTTLGLTPPVLVVLAFLVLAVLVLLTWTTNQRRHSEMLRERFGPEYNRTVEQLGDRRKAEQELDTRTKQVKALDIHPLTTEQQDDFSQRWRAAQARFVDDPSGAVREADRLVVQVMKARGYPADSFELRTALVSVEHAGVVQNYRLAHDIAARNDRGEASTEDLRQALVYYRNLFNELLDTVETTIAEEESR